MQHNTTNQKTFVESGASQVSVDHFISRVATLKEMTCDVKGTMLSLIASLDVSQLPVSNGEFQQLIVFVTENCQVIEKTLILKSEK